jgi:hypothetical protein
MRFLALQFHKCTKIGKIIVPLSRLRLIGNREKINILMLIV